MGLTRDRSSINRADARSLRAAPFVHHHQRGNFLFFHHGQRRVRQTRSRKLSWDRASSPLPAVRSITSFPRFSSSRRKSPSLMIPARLLALDHCGHSQLLARHFIDHIRHSGRRRDTRQSIARMHQRFDARQFLSQLSARMQVGKVFFLEPASLTQSHGQRIAESKHGGSRSRRRKPERASLLRDRTIQGNIGSRSKRGAGFCGADTPVRGS